jgi:hypothetical protein
MSLQTLLTLSQIVGAVVVVATLLSILVQMYQTNRIAKAQLTLHTWMQTGELQLALAHSQEKADFLRRVTSGVELGEAEKLRAVYVLSVALGTHEAAFNLRKRGLIEEGACRRLEEGTRLYMKSAGWRSLWFRRRTTYEPVFRALVDAMVAEAEAEQGYVSDADDAAAN